MKIRKPKIVFFGTSDRSEPILKALNKQFDLVLCITKKDRIVGRKQEITQTAVKKWALENNIKHIEISSLRDTDLDNVISAIIDSEANFGIVADFSYIIPQRLINLLNKKLINIHFSLLPKYRGASPVQFAILNGDSVTGITYQLISSRLDAGDILYQIGYKVDGNETSGELYETLFQIASDKLPFVIESFISGGLKPIPQDEDLATYTFSKTHPQNTYIYKEDALIYWKENSSKIDCMVRAFNPWPISWTYVSDFEECKILNEGDIKFKDSVEKNLIIKIYKTKVIGEKLNIEEIQIESKKKMSWEEFKNGFLVSKKQ